MRKRITDEAMPQAGKAEVVHHWLDLEPIVEVELTSEDAAHPVESALKANGGSGWRAATAGRQSIHILFDSPRTITHIQLVFEETVVTRTQEFVLSWSADNGTTMREIVRQQYNFSPAGETREVEDYTVTLEHLTRLELDIIPDISGGEARASLAVLRLA